MLYLFCKISVTVDCPEGLLLSHDSKWTAEAVFNLLDNAVKYTPAGGAIRVSVEQWEMYVKLSVSDTGKGISESNQAAGSWLKCPSLVTFQPHFLCRFGHFCDIWIL